VLRNCIRHYADYSNCLRLQTKTSVRLVRAATAEPVLTNTEDMSAFVAVALLATTVKEVSRPTRTYA